MGGGNGGVVDRRIYGALGSPIPQQEYAKKIGKSQPSISLRVMAARVVRETGITDVIAVKDQWRALSELHSAPRWLWKPLVSRLASEGWTVETARKEAQRLKDAQEPGLASPASNLTPHQVSGDTSAKIAAPLIRIDAPARATAMMMVMRRKVSYVGQRRGQ